MATLNAFDVIARYGTWFHGSDDEFTHALILRSGTVLVLAQGLQIVTVRSHHVPEAELAKLKHELEQQIPAGWAQASYAGYNFITDAEGPQASEIAVLGTRAGANLPQPSYYAAPPDSVIGQLVKAIAKID
jgi:hypothetical protein